MARIQFPELHDPEWLEQNSYRPAMSISKELGCAYQTAWEAVNKFNHNHKKRPRNEHNYSCKTCDHYAWCNVNRQARFPCEVQ